MNRPFSMIKRHALNAALGMLLAVVAGCGVANPVAPIVTPSSQSGAATVARALKNPHHGQGQQNNAQSSSGKSSGMYSGSAGGVTSGQFSDPTEGEPDEPLVIE